MTVLTPDKTYSGIKFAKMKSLKKKKYMKLVSVVFLSLCVVSIMINSEDSLDTHAAETSDEHNSPPLPSAPSVAVVKTRDAVTSPDGRVTSLLNPSPLPIIPNFVHFVYFGQHELFKFHQMLSIKSVYKFIKPDEVLFHCDHEPHGPWWQFITRSFPDIRIITRAPRKNVWENPITDPDQLSAIARLEILREHSGIFLDLDVIVLKPFDKLRRYNFTIGVETFGDPGRVSHSVVVSTSDSNFLNLWLGSYKDFSKQGWDYHNAVLPYEMLFDYPGDVHLEVRTLSYPDSGHLTLLYNSVWDWRHNYAVHLWHRLHGIEYLPRDIKGLNSTFGEIARYIMYGSDKLLE